jgi:hypothetical protein
MMTHRRIHLFPLLWIAAPKSVAKKLVAAKIVNFDFSPTAPVRTFATHLISVQLASPKLFRPTILPTQTASMKISGTAIV